MRVLIAEDETVTRRLLEATLSSWGCDVVTAEDGTAALRLLEEPGAPSFAILDWCMPGVNGLEVCRRLRAAERDEYTYVVMLTKRHTDADLEEGIEAGVDDYLIKPLDPLQLRLCLQTGARITRLQAAARAAASRDGLTGLANRGTVRARLARELERSARDSQPVGVIMADVDHFKLVNDTHGHPVGDDVLREVARRMENTVRSYDTVGRHGGEEFLVVLPGSDLAGARAAAEHVRASIEAEPIQTEAGPVSVTLSLGATSSDGTADVDLETLVETADAALYEAKRGGRDRVTTRPVTVDIAEAS